MEAPDTWMSAAEVAEHLGVSIATVARLAEAGTIPTAYKAPGKTGARIFNRADVLAYATARSAA